MLFSTSTHPGDLTLEITESAFIADAERALVVLEGLKRLGVRIALDDFGTGYSSLSYLQRFPVDIVKIDQNFVAGLAQNPASGVIVSAVVGMSHILGMTVVAEGVETAAQHRAVEALGCDFCQGFYFARPMAAADIGSLLELRRTGGGLPLPALAG